MTGWLAGTVSMLHCGKLLPKHAWRHTSPSIPPNSASVARSLHNVAFCGPGATALAHGVKQRRIQRARGPVPVCASDNESGIPDSASGSTSGSEAEGALKEASQAAATFLKACRTDPEPAAGEPSAAGLTGLLDFVPDKALDAVIAARKTTG